jgi:parallel beta-helix repeat protein
MKRKAIVGLVSTSFLIAMVAVALNTPPLKASGTIYIQADGSIAPLTANITSSDNITYYFTANNYDSLVIQRANVVLDGAGYRLQGPGGGTGIDTQISGPWEVNVTIQNLEIVAFASGIRLSNDANITISENKIRNCTDGIDHGESFNNTISGNLITNNTNGIGGSAFSDSTFSRNIIANNTVGLYLGWANDNVIYENNITHNDYGIWLSGSPTYNNTFYHNNFINNTHQVYIEQTNPNTWDNGYPSGGNYWADFPDLYPSVGDVYSGSGQNDTGGDGIWDGPYEMDANNTDNYPLTTIIPEFPTWTVTLPIFFTLTAAIAICRRRLTAKPSR